MSSEHLVLAGGGHTHALLLLRWAIHPDLRPQGLITLINRRSTTLYSGMIPGLIAGTYSLDEVVIDLRRLSDQAGVSFVVEEIEGINTHEKSLFLRNRPPIFFKQLSLDVGSETAHGWSNVNLIESGIAMPIKPLEPALAWLAKQDEIAFGSQLTPLTLIGGGLSGVEIALALRKRWAKRPLRLQVHLGQPRLPFRKALLKADISLVSSSEPFEAPVLLCTGNQAPNWLKESGLPVDSLGRVLTDVTLQVIGQPDLFAVGDCGVIQKHLRPPSGVWAVRAALPLAKNLERCTRSLPLLPWHPQGQALQLIGGEIKFRKPIAWALWGNFLIGPHPLLWRLKETIDRKFMARFDKPLMMGGFRKRHDNEMACRGCAAKVAAQPLQAALKQANLASLATKPEDAAFVALSAKGDKVLQSVDGFPALVNDPWLNGRITALHACSDLWASGASVKSAQAVITLPSLGKAGQQELLAQSLSGISSALDQQGAQLIGGHSLEARNASPEPASLGIQISLVVNGFVEARNQKWTKEGLELGDVLLLSRGLGIGVIFAAKMAGEYHPDVLDQALSTISTSQYPLLIELLNFQRKREHYRLVHACTDITGFGLIGHLIEMINSTNCNRSTQGLVPLRIKLDANLIPFLQGSFDLFRQGYSSSLAPSNRDFLRFLDLLGNDSKPIGIDWGNILQGSQQYHAILNVIVDPQTCGPLLISCSPEDAAKLIRIGPWKKIGVVV